jgi:hypothetical protein
MIKSQAQPGIVFYTMDEWNGLTTAQTRLFKKHEEMSFNVDNSGGRSINYVKVWI